ncbi:hypothetical protein [Clostridium tagluense]|uniref:hypothetical protein n=1 Tax=Clostridium tagluense TaxID=360422 RepID=UPI001C0D5220|nr:hypothetical protein [Clostridium tagluense]MBU3130559.1 hypothetical protein [Clostridium tagluense]
MIDRGLLSAFNKKVNGNSYFTLYSYRNKNEKNQWSCICSCMDWISVTMDYLINHKYDSENINIMSMQVYTYISSIDIIWQSIQQLHRVIIDVKSIPFKGELIIFSDNDICEDDNEYFKHIRAVFGAHPVNLKDRKGRWFASWPTTEVYTEYDFAVSLYSANTSDKSIVFGFRFSEIEEFLESRYGYLKLLIDELEKQYKTYCMKMTDKVIDYSEDVIEQLKILQVESKNRLDNDYYKYIIDELIIIFEAENTMIENKKVVKDYRNKLNDVIIELKNNLQQMKFEELKSNNIIEHNHPQKIHYPLSKIYECLNGSDDNFMYSYYIKIISEFLKEYTIIKEHMDKKEIFMLIKAGLYNYWTSYTKE